MIESGPKVEEFRVIQKVHEVCVDPKKQCFFFLVFIILYYYIILLILIVFYLKLNKTYIYSGGHSGGHMVPHTTMIPPMF